ncbi:MAG: LacI family DNA-binding transcriptional regulator [Acidimicrobiia bacterium]
MSPPTIVDVAERAGVSVSLVSRALRGLPGVSPARREAILSAADELDFRPNAAAQALVSGRTHLVGVILSDLTNPYHAEVAASVERALEDVGREALLGNGRRDGGHQAKLVEVLLRQRVEAIIAITSRLPQDAIEKASRVVPTIVVGRVDPRVPGVDTLVGDDEAGVSAAVEHLVELGHERIAHLGGGDRPTVTARRRAYEAAMRAHRLERWIRVAGESSTHDGGRQAVSELWADDGRFTALVAANDLMATGACAELRARGLAVPEDVSVVGYDDSSLASSFVPSLTSVDQPFAEITARAIELLESRLAGRRRARHEVVAPHLVVRDSTGPPSA